MNKHQIRLQTLNYHIQLHKSNAKQVGDTNAEKKRRKNMRNKKKP